LLPLLSLPNRSPVMADGASHRCTDNGMAREMSGNAPNNGSLKASGSLCGPNRCSN
jgi:hypothetical protein